MMFSIITSCFRVLAMHSRHSEYALAPVAITDRLDAGRRCLLKVNSTQLALQPPYPPAYRYLLLIGLVSRQDPGSTASLAPHSFQVVLGFRVRVRAWLAASEAASTATSPGETLRQHCHHQTSLVNWFMFFLSFSYLHWSAFLVLLPRRGLPWRDPPRQAQETKPQADFAVHAHTISGLNQADLPRGTARDI
jgi:hypothetical protein